MTSDFLPTRTAALERLAAFLPHAGRTYAARRNYDLGAGQHEHVSCLSPYLRCRLITEQEVIQAVLERHSYKAAEKFVQEVFWRTYWKGWLELRPGVWGSYQTALNRHRNALQTQSGLRSRWEAACKGETDIACFNSWAQELVVTGYLHNHARMWLASIWIFTLRLPWELGADFLLRHLLDGDPASNTLSWRWVAGLQTEGKTYRALSSNIAKFTEERFDPHGQLSDKALPVAPFETHSPKQLQTTHPVDSKLRTGLLLHEEDLSPGFLLEKAAPIACAVLTPRSRCGPLLSAQPVVDFRMAAQKNMLERWQQRLVNITYVEDAAAIQSWAATHDITQIVTAYAPVGPVATELSLLSTARNGPALCQVMRPYDRLAWPHATRGFFRFRKNIPELIFNFNENHSF